MKKVFVFLLIISFICVSFAFLYSININIISSEPNMSEWVLSNEKFVIVPEINETISFHIEDKQKRIVFICEKEWRTWDFKFLGIDADSNITISTADMGDEYYCYNGKTWILNSSNIENSTVCSVEELNLNPLKASF